MSDAHRSTLKIGARFGICLAASASLAGCMVVSAATTIVSAGTTVVGAGVSATATVAKGAVKVTKAVVNAATDDDDKD